MRTSDTRSRNNLWIRPHYSRVIGRKIEALCSGLRPLAEKRISGLMEPFLGARKEPKHDNAHTSGRLQGATRSTLGEPDVDYTLPYGPWGRFVTIKCRCPIGTPPEWATSLGPLRTFLRARPLRYLSIRVWSLTLTTLYRFECINDRKTRCAQQPWYFRVFTSDNRRLLD